MAAESAGVGLVAYDDRDSASDSEEEEYLVPRKKTRVDNSGGGTFYLQRTINH